MKKSAKKGFTPEEQLELLKNPYTRTVTDSLIKFTDEFNELFIKRHAQAIGPSMIFKFSKIVVMTLVSLVINVSLITTIVFSEHTGIKH